MRFFLYLRFSTCNDSYSIGNTNNVNFQGNKERGLTMEIKIESLAFGGAGIGRNEGKVVFVRGGLPGDILKVRITKDKGKYAEAEIEDIVRPSL
ncbi:MAG: TRAM domain-containing protein, partial [Thermodesulfobacteriota bacterium]